MKFRNKGTTAKSLAILPRVLVLVRGGVAEVVQDADLDVYVMDYDNEPLGSLPERYRDMVPCT